MKKKYLQYNILRVQGNKFGKSVYVSSKDYETQIKGRKVDFLKCIGASVTQNIWVRVWPYRLQAVVIKIMEY